MNIKEAKEQIKNAINVYFTKDEFGNYKIPIERQRPVFLMGPPGIGKTAIMEQIAEELGVGLVSYSMTHHTRQSALGLPFIEKKIYDGTEYSVSEYTMSEIIASVYEMMEDTGIKEGILFLDEINCVSETLSPAMLQFLQYKVFGRHRVPNGWIVVTAGNPPEYNDSVREFDVVTWDRLKRIDVEPDYGVWKEYAYKKGIHPSITTYLDIKKDYFYRIETTIDGKAFATARGWCDLSDMLNLYEEHNLKIDNNLVGQYLQNKEISRDFSIYYDLFKKYQSDYQVDQILEGKANDEIKSRAKNAKFDERLSVIGLLLDGVLSRIKQFYNVEQTIIELMNILRNEKQDLIDAKSDFEKPFFLEMKKLQDRISIDKKASKLSCDREFILQSVIRNINEILIKIKKDSPKNGKEAFDIVNEYFNNEVKSMKKQSKDVGKKLENMFKFSEEVFEEGQEILILVTELTMSYHAANFISRYGCKEYFKHNKELLFYERQKELIEEIELLEL